MALKLNDKYVKNFITDDEIKAMATAVEDAHQKIENKSGEGADFLGWVDLPVNYDKEEFERIKVAAEKIKSDEFRNLCNDLFACKSGNVVNKRLEIYYGPAGTGKTTEAIAKYPDAKVTVCNETMDSTDLMKTFSFNDENGNPVFKPSALQEDMIAGRPHILDEINLLPLSSLRYLQGILDGKKEIEFEGNLIQIADGFKIIGTMNLIVNGQVFNLPEPIVDRASVLKSYESNSNILADYAF